MGEVGDEYLIGLGEGLTHLQALRPELLGAVLIDRRYVKDSLGERSLDRLDLRLRLVCVVQQQPRRKLQVVHGNRFRLAPSSASTDVSKMSAMRAA
jgi:hypothetical protein